MRLPVTLAVMSSFAALAACASGAQNARLDGPIGTASLTDFVDPTINLAQWESQSASTFFLASDSDFDTINYASPRAVSFCISGDALKDGDRAVGVRVTHDGDATVVPPGACRSFTAQHMTVAATDPIPAGMAIRGHISATPTLSPTAG